MLLANGFPKISGVFYSVFHPELGSKPCIQCPDGSVKWTETSQVPQPFIDFDAIKSYIIPKPALCNRLISLIYKGYRVTGYPVNITGEHYQRNSFTFNLCFIFPADVDTAPYDNIIVRTAKMLKALEEQSLYLSKEANLLSLDSTFEQMYQDLNSFSECQIPLDASNKIDIKLFPKLEAPPTLHDYDVPLTTVKLVNLLDETWDPTLERLLPYINGINSIKQISDLASADYTLTLKGIQHLIHYGCAVIIGIFQFSNIYAPTSSVADICSQQVFQEFCDYVYKRHIDHRKQKGSIVTKSTENRSGVDGSLHNTNLKGIEPIFGDSSYLLNVKQVFKLYASFNSGVVLSSWCHSNRDILQEIDLNRFLAFGILKRLIYQVHSYPLWIPRRGGVSLQLIENAMIANGLRPQDGEFVQRIFDQPTHFDSICTELRASKATVSRALKSMGDWAVVNI